MGDWMPGKRDDVLHMGKAWIQELQVNGTAWGVPTGDVSALQTLTGAADTALRQAKSGDRTETITAQCRMAFDELKGKMRAIKDRYLRSPPLGPDNYPRLLLHMHDTEPTSHGRPTGQIQISISFAGKGLIKLYLGPVAGTDKPAGSHWFYTIYEGIMPHGGATLEEAAGPKHYLMRPPLSGDELLFLNRTRRGSEMREFPAEEAGKTAYYCGRYENAKGEKGPWGPLVSTIIP